MRGIEHNRRVPIVDGSDKKIDGSSTSIAPRKRAAEVDPVLIATGYKTRPWRLSTDLPRALLDTLIAGIGYLL